MGLSPALRPLFENVPVLVTGHTGFKGSWLCLWLQRLGAQVHGLALAPPTQPSLFDAAGVAEALSSHELADIRDPLRVQQTLARVQPRLVFHLAAQPLVRASYQDPLGTWSANVMGTAHVLEAIRQTPSVKAAVCITTDKCYENREWLWGYRENDPLGGYDPYSASKAGAELVIASYRQSWFQQGGPLVASGRAGNVIGGGDWALDRLVPDAYRAVAAGQTLEIRSPGATRPWQHVLESLNGYLHLAAGLLQGRRELASAFNFGPGPDSNCSVAHLLNTLQAHWPELQWDCPVAGEPRVHEANFLYLDSAKARQMLGWQPRWDLSQTLAQTAGWYRAFLADPTRARELCLAQLQQFDG